MSPGNAFDAGFIASGEIARLERLIADLRRLADGSGPTENDLANAPLLLNYAVTYRPAPCLRGDVVAHPRLGNRDIFTTQLWAYQPQHRWARTFSRFYRLGNPGNPKVPL